MNAIGIENLILANSYIVTATVDFDQRAEDHQSILVLVVPIGNINAEIFNKTYEKISRIRSLPQLESHCARSIKYLRSYTQQNNDWATFQLHRGVRGIVGVYQVAADASPSSVDLTSINAEFETIKSVFKSTVYDSRLIVLGLEYNAKLGSFARPSVRSNGSPVANGTNKSRQSPDITTKSEDADKERGSFTSDFSNNFSAGITSSAVLAYSSPELSDDLEERISEFASSLFWVIESKRLSSLQERPDRLQCIYAPCERKDVDSLDSSGEGRSFKRRCQGRQKKQLADMCLLSGMHEDALIHYNSAAEILKQSNDWLWYAAALEGLSITTVLMVFLHQKEKRSNIPRNSSFSSRRDSEISNRSGKGRNNLRGSLKSNIGVEDFKSLLPDPAKLFELICEAVENYSKFRDAALINLECNVKASRAMIRLGEFKFAAELLQNVITFDIALSDEQKIQRYLTASAFYAKMGMMRKYAFFRRIAAMNCITPGCPIAAWVQCYHVLLESLCGYGISLDSRSTSAVSPGWSDLQMRVFYELAYTARRINNTSIAVRHLCFLLHFWHKQLSNEELNMMLEALQAYTAQTDILPQPLALSTGQILMPVHFINFPKVLSIEPLWLAAHLVPVKIHKDDLDVSPEPASVFIYSPLQHDIKPQAKELTWVAGEQCIFSISITNPLMASLCIKNLSLIIEDFQLDQKPITVQLSAQSVIPQNINYLVKPQSAGRLRLTGISHRCFGVQSNCKLEDILNVPAIEIDVIGSLPLIEVAFSSSSPNSTIPCSSATVPVKANDTDVISTLSVHVFVGAEESCEITLANVSSVAVETLTLQSDISSDLVSWNNEDIQPQLPLKPQSKLNLILCVKQTKFLSSFTIPTAGADNGTDSLQRVVKGLLTILYSGGAGYSAGYQRQHDLELNITITQCIVLKHISVVPSLVEESCTLVLSVLNSSKYDVDVSSVSIPAASMSQIHLNIPCLEVTTELSLSSNEDIKSHIAKHGHINWHIPNLNLKGVLILDIPWPWTNEQLLILHRRPFALAADVDGYPLTNWMEATCLSGKAITFTLTVLNTTSLDLKPVSCTMTHRKAETLSQRISPVLISGPGVNSWDVIHCGSNVTCSRSLVFLWSGACDLELSFTIGSVLKYSKIIRFIACK